MLSQLFTWTNLVRTTATVVLEAYIWTQMTYLPIWFLNITAILAALTIVLPNVEPHIQGYGSNLFKVFARTIPVAFVVSLLLAFFGAPFFRPPPFRTEVRTLFNSSPVRRDLTVFVVAHAIPTRISPIPFFMYLEMTNLQNVPSHITEYSLAIGRCHLYGLWCTWYPLPTISLESSKLFALATANAPPRSTQITTLVAPGHYLLATPVPRRYLAFARLQQPDHIFEVELHRTIPAHETISGWAAFDHSKGFDIFTGPVSFRFFVRDSANVEDVTVSQIPPNELTGSSLASLTSTGVIQDLSAYPFEPYTK